ncbi:MAG TPA: GntR family transcriptional regulator [Woeseiaceae bacterium]|nr:GntR family transcriptional regulator [Woeseiaceae bacterium]
MKSAAGKVEPKPEASVKSRLQADILTGRFRPGEWLKQVDLEKAYDANRFEVRIALSQMAARHLIDHIPNRGYRVIDPSDRERANLYEVRTILETGAARLVAQRVTDEDIAELAALVDEFSDAIDNKTFQELRERGIPGRRGSWDALRGRRASAEDHARMVDMLRNKDAEGLCYVIYHHLNRWREFSRPDSSGHGT